MIFSPQFMSQFQQMLSQPGQNAMNDAARMPIPGYTGPSQPGVGIPGLLAQAPPSAGPGLNQIPQAMPTPLQPAGPYGQQAMQLAGLLGQRGGGGLLGGPPKGFRIPGYGYGK